MQAEPTPDHKTVLIVVDSQDVRNVAVQMLKKTRYTTIDVNSPKKAIAIVEREMKPPIDLLITDVALPQMSGTELYTRLYMFYLELRVLYMTGYSENTMDHSGVTGDQTACIQKPFTRSNLIRHIQDVLDER